MSGWVIASTNKPQETGVEIFYKVDSAGSYIHISTWVKPSEAAHVSPDGKVITGTTSPEWGEKVQGMLPLDMGSLFPTL